MQNLLEHCMQFWQGSSICINNSAALSFHQHSIIDNLMDCNDLDNVALIIIFNFKLIILFAHNITKFGIGKFVLKMKNLCVFKKCDHLNF